MQINADAEGIYKSYVGRATVTSRSNEIHPYSKERLDSIFDSAAGPDGVLTKEEAEAVNTFFVESGVNSSGMITLNDAVRLCDEWAGKATNYLPSITGHDDISEGFRWISEELGKAQKRGSNLEMEGAVLKVAVFFNRVRKGRAALGTNTISMIRKEIDDFNSMPQMKNLDPGVKAKIREFCLNLLSATAADAQECENLSKAFIDKFFPKNPFYKR